MAPKKKKSSKKPKKETNAQPAGPPPRVWTNVDKQDLEIRIQRLEWGLKWREDRCNNLLESNAELEKNIKEKELETIRTVNYYREQNEKKDEEIEHKQNILVQLLDKLGEQAQDEDQRFKEQETELNELMQQSLDENRDLEEQLESLEEFILHKDQYIEEVEQKEHMLEESQKRFEAMKEKLLGKDVRDYERITRTIINTVEELAEDLDTSYNEKFPETVKWAISETNHINYDIMESKELIQDFTEINEIMTEEFLDLKKTALESLKTERALLIKSNSHIIVLEILKDQFREKKEIVDGLENWEEEYGELEKYTQESNKHLAKTREFFKLIKVEKDRIEDLILVIEKELYDQIDFTKLMATIIEKCGTLIHRSLLETYPNENDEEFEYRIYHMALSLIHLLDQGIALQQSRATSSEESEIQLSDGMSSASGSSGSEIVLHYDAIQPSFVQKRDVGIQANKYAYLVPQSPIINWADAAVHANEADNKPAVVIQPTSNEVDRSPQIKDQLLTEMNLFSVYHKTKLFTYLMKQADKRDEKKKRKKKTTLPSL